MILRVVPPAQVDVQAETPYPENPLVMDALAGHISAAWSRAKSAKTEIQERLLRCERQRRGVYETDKLRLIRESGGSEIYMMLTDVKCRAAESWIKDVLFTAGERPFDLEPSEDPVLPPEVKLGIIDLVKTEAEEFLRQGAEIHPEVFRTRMEEVHDQIRLKLKEEARDAARRMGDLIEDQLHEGNWPKTLKEFISDYTTYPTAIAIGPTVRRKKALKWGENYLPVISSEFTREVERCSPYDFYPAPNASNVDDGDMIVMHRLSRAKLESFLGVPGWNADNIRTVLERYRTGYKVIQQGETERNDMEGKPHASLSSDNELETIRFWGSVQGFKLLQWGMKDLEPHREYEIEAWMIGAYVVKAVMNPDPLGRRPIHIASWEEIPGSIWGLALAEQMRDVQDLCNGAARAIANNMGIASGPQVEVQIDRLADGEDVTQLFPWRVWQTTTDRTGGGQPAIRFFQPQMNVDALLTVYMQFSRQADEVTGIPAYLYSGTTGSGAGRTASGLSMLMDNAAKGIKQAIAQIDTMVAGVVSRFYIHNMMFHPDPYVKGDFKIVAKGAMGLIQREQLAIRRNEFLAATANPVDLQILGPEGRAYLLRENAKSLQMDTDKLVPSIEMLKYKQEQQAQQAQQMQQLPAPQTTDPAGNPAGGMNLVGAA